MLDKKHMGNSIRFVYRDVVKEESGTMIENQNSEKEIGRYISVIAKNCFLKKCL